MRPMVLGRKKTPMIAPAPIRTTQMTDARSTALRPNVQGNRRAAPALATERACTGASG